MKPRTKEELHRGYLRRVRMGEEAVASWRKVRTTVDGETRLEKIENRVQQT